MPSQLINENLWQKLALNSTTPKRKFIQARNSSHGLNTSTKNQFSLMIL